MGSYKLYVPIYLKLSKKETKKKKGKLVKTKTYSLNLNQYKTWHYQTSNKLKKKFKEEIEPQLDELKKLLKNELLQSPLTLNFNYHPGDKRRSDLDNFCTVSCKFLLDALKEHKLIEDDSYKHVVALNFEIGIMNRENPGMEITIQDQCSF